MPALSDSAEARLLRHGRWVLGLSQDALARRLGLDIATLRDLESGHPASKVNLSDALTGIVPVPAPGLRTPRG